MSEIPPESGTALSEPPTQNRFTRTLPKFRGSIGYLVGHFPRSSHTFFWREICQLRSLGLDVTALSTRMPENAPNADGWRRDATDQTEYIDQRVLKRFPSVALRGLAVPGVFGAINAALASEGGRKYKTQSLLWLSAAAALVDACNEHGIRHVHVGFTENASQVAMLAHKLSGITYSVAAGHSIKSAGPNQRAKWSNATFATPISRFLADEARQTLGDASMPNLVALSPRGVDTDEFRRTTPYEPWTGSGPLRLLSCGRMSGVKGHATVVRAIAQLRSRGIDARWAHAGDLSTTDYVNHVRELAEGFGITDAIELHGVVDPAEVRRLHAQSHAFVHVSLSEGLGNAVIESISMGTPVVATGVEGILDIVLSGEQGELVGLEDHEATADAIERIARDPERARAMSDSARERACKHFYRTRGAEVVADCLARAGVIERADAPPPNGTERG